MNRRIGKQHLLNIGKNHRNNHGKAHGNSSAINNLLTMEGVDSTVVLQNPVRAQEISRTKIAGLPWA